MNATSSCHVGEIYRKKQEVVFNRKNQEEKINLKNVKILKIIQKRYERILSFHIQINQNVYYYTFLGIKDNFEIVLKCNRCAHYVELCPTDSLKDIIFDKPKGYSNVYSKSFKLSDPRVTEPNSYGLETFDNSVIKRCLSIKLESYLKNQLVDQFTKLSSQIGKILKIAKTPRGPLFHIQLNNKVYFYAFKGIKLNFKFVLKCTKCRHLAYVCPRDILKSIIYDNPKTPLSKDIDFLDPRVYELESYDLDSFDKVKKCVAMTFDCYSASQNVKNVDSEIHNKTSHDNLKIAPTSEKNAKILKIATNKKFTSFYIEFGELVYLFGYRGVKANFDIVLKCHRKCSHTIFLRPKDVLKDIIFDSPKGTKHGYFPKSILLSDARVCDPDNYSLEGLDISLIKKCRGKKLQEYNKEITFSPKNHVFDQEKLNPNSDIENVNDFVIAKLEVLDGENDDDVGGSGLADKNVENSDIRHVSNNVIENVETSDIRHVSNNVIENVENSHIEKVADLFIQDVKKSDIGNINEDPENSDAQNISELGIRNVENSNIQNDTNFEKIKSLNIENVEIEIDDKKTFHDNFKSATTNEKNAKILKIVSNKRYTAFYFELGEKVYAFGYLGIKANFEMVLKCSPGCRHIIVIRPKDVLKEIIFDSPTISKNGIFFLKSMLLLDYRVCNPDNYSLEGLDISVIKKCRGKTFQDYYKMKSAPKKSFRLFTNNCS